VPASTPASACGASASRFSPRVLSSTARGENLGNYSSSDSSGSLVLGGGAVGYAEIEGGVFVIAAGWFNQFLKCLTLLRRLPDTLISHHHLTPGTSHISHRFLLTRSLPPLQVLLESYSTSPTIFQLLLAPTCPRTRTSPGARSTVPPTRRCVLASSTVRSRTHHRGWRR